MFCKISSAYSFFYFFNNYSLEDFNVTLQFFHNCFTTFLTFSRNFENFSIISFKIVATFIFFPFGASQNITYYLQNVYTCLKCPQNLNRLCDVVAALTALWFFSVPARIASFSDNFTATYREDVKLPCLTVGLPPPEISWKVKGRPFENNDRIAPLAEGSLLIKSVTRTDAGEYSCSVENNYGKDQITHRLIIHGEYIHSEF